MILGDFEINEANGVLRVAKRLDHERQSSYSLVLQVQGINYLHLFVKGSFKQLAFRYLFERLKKVIYQGFRYRRCILYYMILVYPKPLSFQNTS